MWTDMVQVWRKTYGELKVRYKINYYTYVHPKNHTLVHTYCIQIPLQNIEPVADSLNALRTPIPRDKATRKQRLHSLIYSARACGETVAVVPRNDTAGSASKMFRMVGWIRRCISFPIGLYGEDQRAVVAVSEHGVACFVEWCVRGERVGFDGDNTQVCGVVEWRNMQPTVIHHHQKCYTGSLRLIYRYRTSKSNYEYKMARG